MCTVDYPAAHWVSILVHAAAVEGDAEDYDIRIEVDPAVIQDTQPDVAGRERYATLVRRWRYRAESAHESHESYVVQRFLHPLS